MDISYYGHSCFELNISNSNVLIDPFISANPAAASIDVEALNPDFILISHGHQDHIHDAVDIAKRSGATVISNFEIVTWFNEQGVEATHPMNTGGGKDFDFGYLKCLNAVHSSSFPDGSYAGNPMSFLIKADGKTLYYAGDTALHMDMQLVAEEDPYCAFLPIGDNFTMGVKDAIKAAGMIGCNRIIGMHFDTFPIIKIDHDEAKNLFSAAGKQLELMEIGSTISL